MKSGLKITIALLLLVSAALGAWWLLFEATPREPGFQGTRISILIEESLPDRTVVRQSAARAALKLIGSNAIPWLMFQFTEEDPKWLDWRNRWETRQLASGTRFYKKLDRVQMAAQGLNALGHDVRPALPALAQILGDPKRGYWAAMAMSGAGDLAIPYFVEAAIDADDRRSINAVGGMRQVVGGISSTNEFNEFNDLVISALASRLADADARVRLKAVIALGSMGTVATNAIRSIIVMTNDIDLRVVQAASNAVRRIRGLDHPMRIK